MLYEIGSIVKLQLAEDGPRIPAIVLHDWELDSGEKSVSLFVFQFETVGFQRAWPKTRQLRKTQPNAETGANELVFVEEETMELLFHPGEYVQFQRWLHKLLKIEDHRSELIRDLLERVATLEDRANSVSDALLAIVPQIVESEPEPEPSAEPESESLVSAARRSRK